MDHHLSVSHDHKDYSTEWAEFHTRVSAEYKGLVIKFISIMENRQAQLTGVLWKGLRSVVWFYGLSHTLPKNSSLPAPNFLPTQRTPLLRNVNNSSPVMGKYENVKGLDGNIVYSHLRLLLRLNSRPRTWNRYLISSRELGIVNKFALRFLKALHHMMT